jgi:hypothetical protein
MTINKELRDRQMTGIGEAGDPMFTIRAAGGQHAVATPGPIAVGVDLFNNNTTGNIHVPLRTAGGHGAPAVLVSPPEPFCKAKRAQSVDDDETWEANRPAPTLSVFDSGDTRATVAIVTPAPEPANPEIVGTLDASYFKGPRMRGGIERTVITEPAPLAVRRLTPRECERLQGFPDDWTAIPYRGKPASDGPRYKAIGNSMAVPVMKWIGERIAIVDAATKEEV